jgi:hypothetical protein
VEDKDKKDSSNMIERMNPAYQIADKKKVSIESAESKG